VIKKDGPLPSTEQPGRRHRLSGPPPHTTQQQQQQQCRRASQTVRSLTRPRVASGRSPPELLDSNIQDSMPGYPLTAPCHRNRKLVMIVSGAPRSSAARSPLLSRPVPMAALMLGVHTLSQIRSQ
jgi:hypothetical protein